jgi:hypothetical protein
MANQNVKISQLDPAANPAGTELVEVVQSGSNVKLTLNRIKDWIASTLDFSDLQGTVDVEQGGTGANNEEDALNNLLPDQAGNSMKALVTIDGVPQWQSVGEAGLIPPNSVGETQLMDGEVTLIKLVEIAGKKLLGRFNPSTGEVEVINIGNGLTLTDDGDLVVNSIPKQLQSISASVSQTSGFYSLNITLQPTTLEFRSNLLPNGAATSIQVAAPLQLTIPNGITGGGALGFNSNRFMVLAINAGGVVELAFCHVDCGLTFTEDTLINTVAIANANNNVKQILSVTARSNVPYKLVGYIDIGTVGNWNTQPSLVQGAGVPAAYLSTLLPAMGVGFWVSGQDGLDFVVPAGVYKIEVICVGGGGSGYGTAVGGRGGYGGYVHAAIAVKPGDVYPTVPGLGGGTVASGVGQTGQTSTFADILAATGGAGGGAAGAAGANGVGGILTGAHKLIRLGDQSSALFPLGGLSSPQNILKTAQNFAGWGAQAVWQPGCPGMPAAGSFSGVGGIVIVRW